MVNDLGIAEGCQICCFTASNCSSQGQLAVIIGENITITRPFRSRGQNRYFCQKGDSVSGSLMGKGTNIGNGVRCATSLLQSPSKEMHD